MSTRLDATVVIPTYGRDHVLLETVRRVLALDPPPAELLVVDQSPAHVQEVESELRALDRTGAIRWIRLEQPSIPAAMNLGLSLASQEVVLFLDDDVIPAAGLIGAHLDSHSEARIVAGQVLQPGEEPLTHDEETTSFSFRSSRRQHTSELMAGNFSIRRELAISLGGFDERFVAVAYQFEQELADRARRAGEAILYEPAASIRHLRAPSGGTRAYGAHLRTARPSHAVGGYYYLLRSRPRGWPRRLLVRPLRAIRTRHHVRRPWWIVPTLVGEASGLLWALTLFARGPRLLRKTIPSQPGRPILILSQVYPPDPAALGQHMHDVARAMVSRGHRVRVLASARGFTDPSQRFPDREVRDGVEVRRLRWGSLGKGSLGSRSVGGLLFLAGACLRGLTGRRPAAVLAATSPPMAPIAGRLVAAARRAPLTLWLMDLNPDQAIASGMVRPDAVLARLLDAANRAAVRGSRAVVVLDRFMRERVERRWGNGDKVTVIPAWAHEDHVSPLPHEDNPFRARHGLNGKRVVMYSGNLSPVHPLDTMLQAARELRDETGLLFLLVGGGGQRPSIEEAIRREGLDNVRLLPYQLQQDLRFSLPAADVHLVSIGATMVGITHPSKVYGAMAAGRAILYLGPRESHLGELVQSHDIGWHVEHGDVTRAVAVLREIASAPAAALRERGERARAAIAGELAQPRLVRSFCEVLVQGTHGGASVP